MSRLDLDFPIIFMLIRVRYNPNIRFQPDPDPDGRNTTIRAISTLPSLASGTYGLILSKFEFVRKSLIYISV